jgi:hypothetical protein
LHQQQQCHLDLGHRPVDVVEKKNGQSFLPAKYVKPAINFDAIVEAASNSNSVGFASNVTTL